MNLDKLLQTLELAETELRSQYRHNGIKDSNVLKAIIEAQEQVKNCSMPDVGNHVFCPHCGNKRELIVETDLNSGRVCKSALCKGK